MNAKKRNALITAACFVVLSVLAVFFSASAGTDASYETTQINSTTESSETAEINHTDKNNSSGSAAGGGDTAAEQAGTLRESVSEYDNLSGNSSAIEKELESVKKQMEANYGEYGIGYDLKTARLTYKGENVRKFFDNKNGDDKNFNGTYFTDENGTIDVVVLRDGKGRITELKAFRDEAETGKYVNLKLFDNGK